MRKRSLLYDSRRDRMEKGKDVLLFLGVPCTRLVKARADTHVLLSAVSQILWNQPSRDKWVNLCQLGWMTNTDSQGLEASGDPYWLSQTCSSLIPFVQLGVSPGPLVSAAPSQHLWATCLGKC